MSSFKWLLIMKRLRNQCVIIQYIFAACSIIYGTIIEVLQGELTTTRDASIADIIANTIGALIVSIILTIRSKTIVKKL